MVVRSIDFDYDHNVIISPKYTISDTLLNAELVHPIIENFSGRPVAIWLQTQDSVTNLIYSVYGDSSWTMPKNITQDTLDKSSPVFITTDAYNLAEQTDGTNHLFLDIKWSHKKSGARQQF